MLNEIKAANEFEPLTQESEAWKNYVQYVNGIVQKSVLSTVEKLTGLLCNQVCFAGGSLHANWCAMMW